MKKWSLVSLVLALAFTSGCGGGSSTSSSSSTGNTSGSGISGAYEFVATSSSTGDVTLIEADVAANGSQSSASGPSQVQTATYHSGTWYVNGICSSQSPGQNSISATVNGGTIALTFNEGGNTFTGQGTLTGTSISGSYSGNNANCSDSGTFTGTVVPNLAGTFTGTLNFPGGADYVVAALTEGSNYSLTVQTMLSGTDNGNFTFSGSAVGNVMFVSGSINGNAFSLFGYFDSSGQFTGIPKSIAVFDYNTLAYDGLLVSSSSSANVTAINISPTTANANTNGGFATFQAFATVSGNSTPVDVTATTTWTITSVSPSTGTTADFSVTQGTDPVTVTVQSTATVGEVATITASYTSGSTTFTATAKLTVNGSSTLNAVTVTPLGDGLAVGTSANYVATANFSDGSTQNVTNSASWTSSTSGVATVGATTGVVEAVAAGQTTVSATYQGVTSSTALNVVATAAYSDASLSGDYAFTLTATGTNAARQSVPEYFIGSMSFNGKGGIAGAMDSNTAGGVSTNVTVTGSYSVFADGRGTLTLTGSGLPSSSYRLILTSNLLGTISGQFVQFDGKGAATGTLIQQVAGTTLSASEVFRFTGIDAGGNPFGEVGEFTTGSGSTVTSGEFDENDFGVVQQSQTISGGSYSAPASNGRGTLGLTSGSNTSNFVFYVVQAGNLILLSTDTNAPVLLGYAEQQSGSFNDGTLANNTGYGYLMERSPASGRGTFDTIGRIGFNGAGGVNGGAQDEVSGAANDPINSGTYSVASNGRAPVTVVTGDSGTLNYIYYLVTANRAYVLEINDSYGAVGTVDIQSGVSLTDSVLTGNYGFTAVDLSQSQGTSAVVWMSANGQGSVQGIGDVVSGTSLSSVILSGTYSVAVIGRTVILPAAPVGAESFIFYVVSPNESYMLGVLPSFDGTVFIQ